MNFINGMVVGLIGFILYREGGIASGVSFYLGVAVGGLSFALYKHKQ
jgi:hypothetical protein